MTDGEILSALQSVEDKLGLPFSLTFCWCGRLTRKAGLTTITSKKPEKRRKPVWLGDELWGTIQLSTKIFSLKENTKKQLRSIVIHEACHVADYFIHRKLGHGETWEELMVRCGESPSEYHTLKTARESLEVFCSECQNTYSLTKNLIGRRRKTGSLGSCHCGNPVFLLTDGKTFDILSH